MMKNIYLALIVSLVLVSCGNKKEVTVESVISTGDIEKIRIKKKEVEGKQKVINEQLDSLSTAITKLDTIKKLPLVSTFTTKETVFNHYLELQGNVRTKQNVLLYPEMPGILENVFVREGQKVQKGDMLAVINDGGLSEQLIQVETLAELAKTTFERQQRLWNQKIGSEMQYLQSKANYIAQKNTVEQLKRQLEKTRIRAPFDGVVDVVFKEEGTVVAPGPGAEVFRIINLNNMFIEAEVPESYITSITKGKKVAAYFPILGKTVHTFVRQVGNFINPNNRSFKIEISVPNTTGEIKPNLTAKLKINDYKSLKAILIPQSIISENANGEQYVYVIIKKQKNNQAVAMRKIIVTGKTQGDVIEVLSSLKKGVEIIEEGARSVTNGQTVKIIDGL